MIYNQEQSISVIIRLILLASVASSGCSLVYDFGRFEGLEDASTAPPDVNPTNFGLDAIQPAQVDEGAGCLIADGLIAESYTCDPTSPRVAVVIEGNDFIDAATVTLDGAGFEATTVETAVGDSGRLLAFEIAVPIETALGEGQSGSIRVTVGQAGIERSIDLAVRHLDEYSAQAVIDAAGDPVAALQGELYSVISIDAPLAVDGTAPLVMNATSLIAVDAEITPNNGCPGGPALTPGGCEGMGGEPAFESDGVALDNHGGGGGGGNARAGGAGGQANQVGQGQGGPRTPSETLVPLAEHGGGGGGGGKAIKGGDGAGVVAMTAGGSIWLRAAINAVGEPGDNPTANNNCDAGLAGAGNGSGSGAGAGGSVMLRARGTVVLEPDVIALEGGTGGPGADDCRGGNGSDGRLRIDTATLMGDVAAALDVSPDIFAGALITPQPQVVTTADPSVALAGDSGEPAWITVNGGPASSFNLGSTRAVDLAAGFNTVCVHVTDPDNGTPVESFHCVNFIYLP
jgi:hypothetical protein